MIVLIGIYLSLAVVVAFYGRECRMGFWGVLLFSVLLTPIVLFYGIISLRPAVKKPVVKPVIGIPAKLKPKWWAKATTASTTAS